MRFHLLPIISSLLTIAQTSQAGYIQINYYYNTQCTSFAVSPPAAPKNGCYNWSWTGAVAANIANCDGLTQCVCAFFREPNCLAGTGVYAINPPWQNCAVNNPGGFKSFRCDWG